MICMTEKNMTIISDQSELKQGNDGRMKEKNARKQAKQKKHNHIFEQLCITGRLHQTNQN